MRSVREQIKTFLVDRYGDFVLYRPPLKASTYLLWFGPFVLLAVAGGILLYNIRKRSTAGDGRLSEAEREKLRTLVDNDNPGDGRA